MTTRSAEPTGRQRTHTLGWLVVLLVGLASYGVVPLPAVSAAPSPAPPLAAAHQLAGDAAGLRAAVQASPVLAPALKARYTERLDTLVAPLAQAAGLERQIAADGALLQILDAQRAIARIGLDHLRDEIRADLQALGTSLDLSTAPVSVTARTVAVTATAAITTARVDLQIHTAALALTVQTSARVLALLALNAHVRVDAQRLDAHLRALARRVHLGVGAIMSDLRLLGRSDPSAAGDARSGLASGLAAALATLTDTLTGATDTRESRLRLDMARQQAAVTRLLNGTALTLATLQRAVLGSLIGAAPLSAMQRPRAMAGLPPTAGLLGDAAVVSARLAVRLADLGPLQDAQARIDQEIQKAQADIDGILARADTALQGRLRSDVTVTISDTVQTIHVHLNTIDVGALVRDLDFNVKLGLSVLQIAALHAEVAPSTHQYTGTSRTTISGVDMQLQVRLHGLQARIRTAVAAVRAMQQQESAAMRARIAALRTTLANVLAPLVRRYQADVSRLQGQLTRDLAAANLSLHRSRQTLARLVHLQQLQGWVMSGSMVALHRAPNSHSSVAGWVAPTSWLPLVGYVWGWTVHNPDTGVSDGRWYVVAPMGMGAEHTYLYVPAALMRVTPLL